ncbi:TPA: aldo/keto reductase, partial [Burkholderia cenocepacia]
MALNDTLPADNRLGFGAAPLGNMFRDIPDAEAHATVEAAWARGIRYFDTAPSYGAGLAEARLGDALAGRRRDDYFISTKVGRIVLDDLEEAATRDYGEKSGIFAHGRANRLV